MHTRLFPCLLDWKWGHEMEGGQGLVQNSSFGSKMFCTTFYRIKISFSFFNTTLFLCVSHFLKILVAIFILFICALWYSKWCNINKCTVLCFMHTIFYIVPTCFGAIISTSSEHWYLHFFISKHNSTLSETASWLIKWQYIRTHQEVPVACTMPVLFFLIHL